MPWTWRDTQGASTQYRAVFDPLVFFANGGDLTVHDLGLDVPDADVDRR